MATCVSARRQEDALGVAAHERDAAEDPHRAERDDERMDAEADDQRAVDAPQARPIAERDGQAERERRQRIRAARCARSTIAVVTPASA